MALTGKLSIIEDNLNDYLSRMPGLLPVAWDNVDFTPHVGQPYVAPAFLPNQPDLAALGVNSPVRYVGLYRVPVFGVVGRGSFADSEHAEAIREYFAPNGMGVEIRRNGVNVRIGSHDGSPSVPWRSSSFVATGWRVTPLTIPWWCDV